MTEFFVEILFQGVDLESSEHDEALDRADIAGAERFDGLAKIGASIEAPNPIAASQLLIQRVLRELPSAEPVRAARDLVNTSEIAERTGVTRQAVRNWSSGERRSGNFPHPIGIIGDQRIWEWGAVNAWLRSNLALDDGLFYPTPSELSDIDVLIRELRASAAIVMSHTESWQYRADWAPLATRNNDVDEVVLQAARVAAAAHQIELHSAAARAVLRNQFADAFAMGLQVTRSVHAADWEQPLGVVRVSGSDIGRVVLSEFHVVYDEEKAVAVA